MNFTGTCEVIKRNKRLHIAVQETGEILYTPPNHVKLPDRAPLQALAHAFNLQQARDIGLIIGFESVWGRKVRG